MSAMSLAQVDRPKMALYSDAGLPMPLGHPNPGPGPSSAPPTGDGVVTNTQNANTCPTDYYHKPRRLASKAVHALLRTEAPPLHDSSRQAHDHPITEPSPPPFQWGAVYNDSTRTVWSWDKRIYTDKAALAPKLIPMPPAWEEGKYHLQEFFGMIVVVVESITQ
jgi:hypothetical protein